MDKIRDSEKRTEELKVEAEELDQELTVAQKKRLIKDLKRSYGPDWKSVWNTIKSMKFNYKTANKLYLGGSDSQERLRQLSAIGGR